MADWLSKVLTAYKADTSDHKSKMKELRGLEKQAAKERLSELEQHNKSIDSTIAGYAKAVAAVGSLVAAYKGAQAAAKAYLEDQRLEAAAAGANIDRLTKATKGLIEHDQLLAFAAKAQHGAWKLNEEQMEKVLHGAMALRKTMGVELQPTVERLTDAIGSGQVRALREFGIQAKDGQEALRKLDSGYQALHGNVNLAGDSFVAAGVKMHDSWDDLEGQLGRLVLALEPAIEAFATFVGWIGDAINAMMAVGDVFGSGQAKFIQAQQNQGALRAQAARVRQRRPQNADVDWARGSGAPVGVNPWDIGATNIIPQEYFDMMADDLERQADALQGEIDRETRVALKDAYKKLLEERRQRHGPPGSDTPYSIGEELPGVNPFAKDATFKRGVAGGLGGAGAIGGMSADTHAGDYDMAVSRAKDAAQTFQRLYEQMQQQQVTNVIDQIFGPVENISAHAEAISIAASAWDALGAGVGAAMDAWITGSESMGEAAKHAIGEALRATAVQLQVEALKDVALGTAALALGPIGGHSAAHYFAAAGMAEAGALAAAMGARALGAGGSAGSGVSSHGGATAGGGRSAGSYLGGGGSSRGEQTHIVNVYMGGGAEEMTDRERRHRLARAVHKGLQGKSRTVRMG